ncbi:hypothetical protein BH160DRAFT_5554 [Burkholderia sp. H160]|nr:hypothetical protein BH160DRAFT_5554 [Burkholderia sp. H160]
MGFIDSHGKTMRVLGILMQKRAKEPHKRDIEAAEPVTGDLTINHEQSAQCTRNSKVASFQQFGAADAQLLPTLHDVEWVRPRRVTRIIRTADI